MKIIVQPNGDVKGITLKENEVEDLLTKNGFAADKKSE